MMPKCFLCNSEKGPFVNVTKDIYLCSKCLERAEKGGLNERGRSEKR